MFLSSRKSTFKALNISQRQITSTRINFRSFSAHNTRKNPFRTKDGVVKIGGYPLPWWGVAIHGIGGIAAGAYYMTNFDFEDLTKKASTSAWGHKVQLEALQALYEWQDFEMLGMSCAPALAKAGLFTCISSGIRSQDADVRAAAWSLASSVSMTPASGARLLSSDVKSHPMSYDTNRQGKDNTNETNGLWNLMVTDLFEKIDQSPKLSNVPINELEKSTLSNDENKSRSWFSFMNGSVEASNMEELDTSSHQEDLDEAPRRNIDISTLSMVQTLSNLTEPKTTGFGLQGPFKQSSDYEVYGVGESLASCAGCQVSDPRLVLAVVELLTMIYPDCLQSLPEASEHQQVPAIVLPKFTPKLQEVGVDVEEFQDLSDILVEEMISEMGFVLIEVLHNIVATDQSGDVCRLLCATKPLALLHYLTQSQDVSIVQLSSAPLHAVMTECNMQAKKLIDKSQPNSLTTNMGKGEDNAVVELMQQNWGLLFPNKQKLSQSAGNKVETNSQEEEVKTNRQLAQTIFENTLDLSYTQKSMNYKACNLIDIGFNAMVLASIYAPIRRWLMWRINGESKLAQQLQALSGVTSPTHTLRSALLRSAVRNSAGAIVLSTCFGFHGLIEETFRRMGSENDLDRSLVSTMFQQSGKVAVELGSLGLVLGAAPYCVLPAVLSHLLMD